MLTLATYILVHVNRLINIMFISNMFDVFTDVNRLYYNLALAQVN